MAAPPRVVKICGSGARNTGLSYSVSIEQPRLHHLGERPSHSHVQLGMTTVELAVGSRISRP